MKSNFSIAIYFGLLSSVFGCSDSKKTDPTTAAKSYSFSATGSASFKLKSTSLGVEADSSGLALATGPTLCSSVVCFTPTSLTGKYYGTGFLIQSAGNGMVAYFGQDNWSSITGTSKTYSFDTSSPTTNSGSLYCCNGTGDLSSENTYISDAIYLFAYLDATFTVTGVTGNTSMNREFTVRFILADDAIATAKRGDLMLKDPNDGVFKWMDPSISAGGNVGNGTLVITRPSSPITMNASVKDWTNPFGAGQGNQSIPVIYAPLAPESGEVYQVSENDLNESGKTYTYNFDPTNFVMFPTFQTADKNSLYSYVQLLSNIHLGGLPHSGQSMGVGNPASTVLKVTGP
jgi:hypothetical protein